jgi:toxin YoeB
MNSEFTQHGWEDHQYWIKTDLVVTEKINSLISSIRKDPFKGEGKPEPLKADYKGYWSRRINREHRFIYSVSGTRGIDQRCTIIQCRFHY